MAFLLWQQILKQKFDSYFILLQEHSLCRTASVHTNITLRHIHTTIVAVDKQQVLHILCVCVSVALVIQRTKRMPYIILSTAACPAVPYSSTSSR